MFKKFRKKHKTEKNSYQDKKAKNGPDSIPSFKYLWANGYFDKCDYYALTTPLDQWNADYPAHCLSEAAGEITEENWGIVTWHLVIYVYSNLDSAKRCANHLGENVKPLKLKCLSCFVRAFSTHYNYVDIILDESWHMKSFTCRDLRQELEYGRVGHVRIDSSDSHFQLTGCAGDGSLEWEPYRRYDDPKLPTEWCRPVPFPGEVVFYDHSEHGGYMDMDFLLPADTLEYYEYKGNTWARDLINSDEVETIFSRPVGPLAFAKLLDEKVRITRGEGVWVPIARDAGNGWYLFPWSQDLDPLITSFLEDPSQARRISLNQGGKFYTNKAVATLENAFLIDPESDADKKTKARDQASQLLSLATELTPGDWYAQALLRDINSFDLNKLPAVIHADRINWHATNQSRDKMDEELEKAMAFVEKYELALHNYSAALNKLGFKEDSHRALKKLLSVNPTHSQGNYDLALIHLQNGDEELEMKHYMISSENDPNFASPLYNIGKTYEDRENIELAKQYYLRTLDVDPFFVEAIEQLGFITFQEGQTEDAEKYFLRSLQADPMRIQSYEHVVWFANKTENKKLLNYVAQLFQYYLPREFENYWQ